jgi:hypothetical protein
LEKTGPVVPAAERTRPEETAMLFSMSESNVPAPPVSDAYEIAKAGGPHHGWLEKQRKLPTVKLLKSIRSLEKQIALHRQWIADPYSKLLADTPLDRIDDLVQSKWPHDIQRQQEQIAILQGVLHERSFNET